MGEQSSVVLVVKKGDSMSRHSTTWKVMKWVLLGLLALVFTLVGSGFAYRSLAMPDDRMLAEFMTHVRPLVPDAPR